MNYPFIPAVHGSVNMTGVLVAVEERNGVYTQLKEVMSGFKCA